MMELGDVVPVFQLLFFGVLPSLLLLIFFAIVTKLIKKGQARLKKFEQELKKGEEAEKLEGAGEGRGFYMNAFHEVIDFIFSDALVAIVIILPMLLMVLNFLFSNSVFMLNHFWDYTYPALAVIMAVTALKIWSTVMYKLVKVTGGRGR